MKIPPAYLVSPSDVSAIELNRPLAVTIEMTRKLTSLGNTTVWALIKERRLQTVKIGRRTLVLFESIERLLDQPH
jgi:hypothetical protein